MTRANTENMVTETASTDEKKVLLSPIAALETLRVIESRFDKSTPSTPLDGEFTKDSQVSQTTAVASPTKAAPAEDKEANTSSSKSSGTTSPPTSKRNSSYRKSVPKLEDLEKGLGISSLSRNTPSPESSERASSLASTAPTETPSWISSLTTLEAIRVLAYQQTVSDAAASKESFAPTETTPTAEEVSALRYALSFTLARADKLAEALNRVSEDKVKVETELEILRRNVLSMLGSKPIFAAPAAPSSRGHPESGSGRSASDHSIVEEEEELNEGEGAAAKHAVVAAHALKEQTPEPQVRISGLPAISRPPRTGRTTKAAIVASTTPASGGVSIASLRKNNPAAAAISSGAAQRYEPSRRGEDGEDAASEEEDEDDDEFDMYPFAAPRRRALPEVSMTDFLNASRMDKAEIEEHDARRELERSHSEDTENFYAGSSTSSHAPLSGRYTMRSLDSNRRGFFKNITKLVDEGRARRSSRRTSLISKPSMTSLSPVTASRDQGALARSNSATMFTRVSSPSNHFTLTYEEESIIPAYPNTNADRRQKTMSMSNSLRESLERQSLREAGIRHGR